MVRIDSWRHFRTVTNLVKTGRYFPPEWYDVARLVPPPQGPFHAKAPKPIRFPEDRLRSKIAHSSRQGAELATYGMNPIPWWFAERPMDTAIKRVKEIMRVNKVSEDEAIRMLNREIYHANAQKLAEIQIAKEAAIRNGQALTLIDALRMARQIKTHAVREGLLEDVGLTPHQENRNIFPEPGTIAFDSESVKPKTDEGENEVEEADAYDTYDIYDTETGSDAAKS